MSIRIKKKKKDAWKGGEDVVRTATTMTTSVATSADDEGNENSCKL